MPKNLTKETISKIKILHLQNFSNRKIAKKLKIHHKTVSSYLKKWGLTTKGVVAKSANYIRKEYIKCSKCEKIEFEDNFLICRRGTKYEYRLSYCNECRRLQTLNNINSNKFKVLKDIFNRTKLRANKRGIEFNLDFIFLKYVIEKQNYKCFYSDAYLILKRGNGYDRNACSIDRVNPKRGYIKGNIVLCTRRLNSIKSDTTLNELQIWMPYFYEKLKYCEYVKGINDC